MSADMAPNDPHPSSLWEPTAQKYAALRARAEDMVVRLASSEVESDLKPHLTRRWDITADLDPANDPTASQADTSLVSALTTYTALLRLAASALPRPALARVYRRISAHLVNHIAQRAVYAGWSKFTAPGGRALAAEVGDWRAAARAALPPIPALSKGAGPWGRLAEMATVLSLPSSFEGSQSEDAVTFAQAMGAAWGPASAYEAFRARVGVEMDQEEMQAVLRRRNECWR